MPPLVFLGWIPSVGVFLDRILVIMHLQISGSDRIDNLHFLCIDSFYKVTCSTPSPMIMIRNAWFGLTETCLLSVLLPFFFLFFFFFLGVASFLHARQQNKNLGFWECWQNYGDGVGSEIGRFSETRERMARTKKKRRRVGLPGEWSSDRPYQKCR